MDSQSLTIILSLVGLVEVALTGIIVYMLSRIGRNEDAVTEALKERGMLFGKIETLETRLADQREHINDVLQRIEGKVDEVANWIRQKDRDISDFWKDEAQRGKHD